MSTVRHLAGSIPVKQLAEQLKEEFNGPVQYPFPVNIGTNGSGEVITTVPRQVKYTRQSPQIILINSRYKTDGTTSQFTQKLQLNAKGLRDFWLHSIVLPNTIYNVELGINDTFVIEQQGAGVDTSVTLNSGYYSGYSLADEIEAKLNVAIAGWTVTFDPITLKLKIEHATAFKVKPSSSAYFPKYATGFINDSSAFAILQLSDVVLQLSSNEQFYISIDFEPSYSLNRVFPLPQTNNSISAAYQVPNDVPFGSQLRITTDSLLVTLAVPTSEVLTKVRVTVYNEHSKVVNLNGADLQLIIHAY